MSAAYVLSVGRKGLVEHVEYHRTEFESVSCKFATTVVKSRVHGAQSVKIPLL